MGFGIYLMWIVLGAGQPAHQVTLKNGDPVIIDSMVACAKTAIELNKDERILPKGVRRHFFCVTTPPVKGRDL